MGTFISYIVAIILWVIAIIHDANADNLGWVIVDVLAWPVGIIRGLLILFGGV